MKKIIIDRAKWRTGAEGRYATGTGDTQLLNEDGFMCCLGFFCNQSGIPKTKLLDNGDPEDIADKIQEKKLIKKIPILFNGSNTTITKAAIKINDSRTMRVSTKETKLKKLFKKVKVLFIFKGNYTK